MRNSPAYPDLKDRACAGNGICHRQIHALFSETELATRYNSPEALLEHEEVRKFVTWVKRKPPGFLERTRMSSRRR